MMKLNMVLETFTLLSSRGGNPTGFSTCANSRNRSFGERSRLLCALRSPALGSLRTGRSSLGWRGGGSVQLKYLSSAATRLPEGRKRFPRLQDSGRCQEEAQTSWRMKVLHLVGAVAGLSNSNT
jgi:hypothetical protein